MNAAGQRRNTKGVKKNKARNFGVVPKLGTGTAATSLVCFSKRKHTNHMARVASALSGTSKEEKKKRHTHKKRKLELQQ